MKRLLNSVFTLLTSALVTAVLISCAPAASGLEGESTDNGKLLSLTQTPITPTNGNVQINVKLSRTPTTVKYVKGEYTLEDFIQGNIISRTIEADADGKYYLVVTENGKYTFYAAVGQDTKVVETIDINNIDRDAPKAPANLLALYAFGDKKITVTWNASNDTDVDCYILNAKSGTSILKENEKVTGTSYEIDNYTADDKTTVEIKLSAMDKAGNISSAIEYSFVPKTKASVGKVLLDRYHLSYSDTDRKIKATATIQNAELITDGTQIRMLVVDYDTATTVYDNVVATLNKATGEVTAEITAPAEEEANKAAGKNYKVCVKIGDADADTEHYVRFNVSEGPSITMLTSLDFKLGYMEASVYSGSSYESKLSKLREKIILYIAGGNLDLCHQMEVIVCEKANNTEIKKYKVNKDSLSWTAETGSHVNSGRGGDPEKLIVELDCIERKVADYTVYIKDDENDLYKFYIKITDDSAN